jgi:pimeloyl-ACP methyl ester carboxylesterase
MHMDVGTLTIVVILSAGALAVGFVLVRLQTRRAEAEHPPVGRFVRVDGATIHYIEKGSGTTVVLIHGTGVTAEDYVASGMVDKLSRRHRVVAFDRPGYGYSERQGGGWSASAQAELLQKACTELGIKRAIVVGHSWGTLVALEIGLRFPQRVLGLILISGYYFPTPRVDSLLLGIPAIPVVGTAMRHTISPLVGRIVTPPMLRRMFSPDPVPQAFLDRVPLTIMLRPTQLRASAEDAARMVPTAAELASRYGELRVPVAIIAGTDDGIVKSDGQSSRLVETLPRCDFEVIPHAGHMVHHSHADHIVSAVNEMSRHPSSQSAEAT